MVQGLDVVFYGDSIVESWRGTELGVAVDRARGIPDMWGRHFGEPYNAKAFGIASAQRLSASQLVMQTRQNMLQVPPSANQ